jgi:hypothetical protein
MSEEVSVDRAREPGLLPVFLVPAAIFVAGLVGAGLIFARFVTSINEGETRFLAPGEQTVAVEPSQRYHVWLYTEASFDGDVFRIPSVPEDGVVVSVRTGSGAPLPIDSSNAVKSVAGERAESLGSFATGSAPAVSVTVEMPDGQRTVVGVGKLDIRRKVGLIIGAVVLSLAAFFLAVVAGIVLGIRRHRRRQPAGAAAPGAPS